MEKLTSTSFADRGFISLNSMNQKPSPLLISDIYSKPGNHVSFEVFPPKTTKGLSQIYKTIATLKYMNPDYFSVTYGAGGSTAERSLEIASAVQNLAEITCIAHFTCVGMDRDEVEGLLKNLNAHGIYNVLALRGDPPKGAERFVQPVGGFGYASELVEFIRSKVKAGILVAGYPEGHQENPSKEDDLQRLVEKVQKGADGIITQLFFENRNFLEFTGNLENRGVKTPVAAGIFPISSGKQIKRVLEFSNAELPEKLKSGIEKWGDDPVEMEKFGTDFAIEQVEELLNHGHRFFHFYTMNRAQQTMNILQALKDRFPELIFS